MKLVYYILVFIIFTFNLNAQTDTIVEKQYNLKGKLIYKILQSTDCGRIANADVFEFEIITYSDTTYKNKNIGVVIPCPELHGKNFFKLDSTYDMILSDLQTYKWSISNIVVLEKYKLKYKLWVKEIKKHE